MTKAQGATARKRGRKSTATQHNLTVSVATFKKLMDEGLALRRAFAQAVAPMKVVTADDLKARMR